MAQKSLVNKNNGLWPSLLDCLFTGTRMNKVTKEFNKVGQGWAWSITNSCFSGLKIIMILSPNLTKDFIGPILFHQIMSANNVEILNYWSMDDELNHSITPKHHLSRFWCPYIATVQEMSDMTYNALDCSVADIRDQLFRTDIESDDGTGELFKERKVVEKYSLKQPENCFL